MNDNYFELWLEEVRHQAILHQLTDDQVRGANETVMLTLNQALDNKVAINKLAFLSGLNEDELVKAVQSQIDNFKSILEGAIK